jgi:amino acid adenylation domain-containing protein
VNYLSWAAQAYPLARDDGAPVHSSVTFDLTVTSLFTPILAGSRIHLLPEDQGAQDLAQALLGSKPGYSLVKLTPAHLEVLAQLIPKELAAGRTRAFVIGGEALLWEPLSFWRRYAPDTALINEYGPTETVVGCCTYTVQEEAPIRGSIPIGRPIANTRVYVLDPRGEPVPIGVPGELYIGGAGLARGYLNRPDLTAEKFVPDPFSTRQGAQMYRTGDLARYLPDGNIEFLGRIDHQVKLRGYRIELGEIEAVLAENPAVRQAVVLAREDVPGNKRLVAYIVPADPSADCVEASRALVREHLPDYMVPSAYVLLDRIPLTPNGKVDRRALPAPQSEGAHLKDDYVAPRNALEELVAGVWREVLHLEEVGIHDNFFELGGHSLLAAQVVARLARLSKVELPLRRFFETATVSALAAELQQKLGAGESAPLAPVPRTHPLPLSFAQQRVWFLDRLLPGKGTYNSSSLWRLNGGLNFEALRRSLETLVARHETLRTTFVAKDGEPVQVIGAPATVALPLTDLSALAPAEREGRAQELSQAQASQPFDLEKGPLLRARLLRLAAEEHLLLLTLHHIACDGWSMGILWRELSSAYASWANGRAPELPPLPIQYADYAVWQRERLQGQELERQLTYWKGKLAGLSPLELPTDRPRPAVASYQGGQLVFDLPAALTEGLKELSRREGATLFMTLVGAFQVLLYRYSGQEDIAVGTPMAGRGSTELEGLIGFLANTLVLRTDLAGNPTFTELLARVRENALDAYTHQDLPFEKLVEELAPSRDLSRNPLFQVMFVLQNAPGAGLSLPEVQASRVRLAGQGAKFDLTLSVNETATGLRGSWEYSSDLFDTVTIERMAGHFKTLLEGIVAHGQQRIGQLPLLSPAERDQLLVQWNDTAADYPQDRCLQQLFEEQAARTPEAVAVVFEAQRLTYAQLNERANQLAHHLVSLGVGPEVLVGICLERSLELVVGLLGILKAGGAYVPLDPAYPRERLAFMLQDTAAPVLLTQEGLLGQLPKYEGRTLCLDRDWPAMAKHPVDNPIVRTTSESLVYVLYTSGSTGKPKGVMIEHRSLVNFLHWLQHTFPISSADRVLQITPTSFDISVVELFWPLLAAAAMDIARPGAHRVGNELIELIEQRETTILQVVPSILSTATEEQGLTKLKSLRRVFTAGEALGSELMQRFYSQSAAELIDAYGPTETTVYSTFWRCQRDRAGAVVPIGRPIANTQIYILNEQREPVPVGVPGELYIGGTGLARGYLNRPELTAEKFVPDPLSARSGARLYRTGDLARYLPDGKIEFLGRIDHQVKLRGLRIELGEIEAVLAEHPAVRHAVVLVREDAPGDKRLVAYMVQTDPSADCAEALRAFLRERLPDYMVPSAYVLLDRLPLTPNGKLDRKALPAPESGTGKILGDQDQPATRLELELVHIWQRLFNRQGIGRFDNFFDLGGHSLLAVRLVAEIEKLLGHKLPIITLFHSPTIELLARRLSEKEWMPRWSSLVPLQPLGDKPPFYLTHGWGGWVYGFLPLAQYLSPDQPTYGLQAVGLDGEAPRHTSIETMAAHYVREIVAFQPHGPYYLAGYSMGGLIAYEMAQRLHEQGHRVALLALLDTVPLGGVSWRIYGRVMLCYLSGRFVFHLRRCWRMPNQDRLKFLLNLRSILRYWSAQNRSKPVNLIAPPAVGITQAPEVAGFKDYYQALASAYRVQSYPGTVDVFVSEDAPPHWVACWPYLARGGASFHPTPGKHLQLFSSDYLPLVAKTLRTVLQGAQDKA